ncbi:MAG TPA: hypothetical protein VGW78_07355 [Candidatus Babeliales bacterium]|jgi:hypothetical protein|nr:hypothetical protein [Candidatus Babeliales bacterium]
MNKNTVTHQFHHMGIPTTIPREGERYSSTFKMWTSDGENQTIRIQYHRFAEDSPLHPLIKTMTHIAFKVHNIDAAIEGKKILLEPYFPFARYKVAIVEIDGAPIEFIETDLTEEEIWNSPKTNSYMYPEK